MADHQHRAIGAEPGQPVLQAGGDCREPFTARRRFGEKAAFGIDNRAAEFGDDILIPAALPLPDIDFKQACIVAPIKEIALQMLADDRGGLLGAPRG